MPVCKTIISCLILFSVAFGAVSQSITRPGFFLDDWQPRRFAAPAFSVSDISVVPTASDTLAVFTDTVALVPTGIFGNNFAAWNGSSFMADSAQVRHLANANISTMRWPGGSWADIYFWDGVVPPTPYKSAPYNWDPGMQGSAGWLFTNTSYYQMLRRFNSKPLFIANFGYSRYGDTNQIAGLIQAAHYAAQWVRDARANGFGGAAWEIGNENFGTWEAGSIIPLRGINGRGVDTVVGFDTLNGSKYGRGFCTFYDSMKSADPTIHIGAVASETRSVATWFPIMKTWNRQMLDTMKARGVTPDFLSIHQYTGGRSTFQGFMEALDSVKRVERNLADVQTDLTASGFDPQRIPIAVTEFNLSGQWNRITTSFCSTMWLAATLGSFINNGVGTATLWECVSGCDSLGTVIHSMLAQDGKRCGMPYVPSRYPLPSFYTYYYYTRMFGDVSLRATSSNPALRIFASRFGSGEAGLVVINASGAARTASIDIRNFSPGTQAWRYELHAADTSSTEPCYAHDNQGRPTSSKPCKQRQFSINGIDPPKMIVDGVDTTVQSGPDYTTVPARLYDPSIAGGLTFAPWSVNYLVISGTNSGVRFTHAPGGPASYTVVALKDHRIRITTQSKVVQASVFNSQGRQLLRILCNSNDFIIDLPENARGCLIVRLEYPGTRRALQITVPGR